MKTNTLASLATMLVVAAADFSIEHLPYHDCQGEGTVRTVYAGTCAPTTSPFASFRLYDNWLLTYAKPGEALSIMPDNGCWGDDLGNAIVEGCAYGQHALDNGQTWNPVSGTCISWDSSMGVVANGILSWLDPEMCHVPVFG